MTDKKSNKRVDETINTIKQGIYKFIDRGWKEQNTEGTYDNSFDSDSDSDSESEFRVNETVSNKVRSIINDFIEAAPLIEAAGFRIRDMEIELSVIPKLIPHFEKFIETDETTRINIIEQVQDKKLVKLLLKALFKADNFQQSLKMGNLEFAGIEIEITAIPAVRLLYKNPEKFAVNSTDLVE